MLRQKWNLEQEKHKARESVCLLIQRFEVDSAQRSKLMGGLFSPWQNKHATSISQIYYASKWMTCHLLDEKLILFSTWLHQRKHSPNILALWWFEQMTLYTLLRNSTTTNSSHQGWTFSYRPPHKKSVNWCNINVSGQEKKAHTIEG